MSTRPSITPKVFTKTVLNTQRESSRYGFRTTRILMDDQIPPPIWNLAIDSVIRDMNLGKTVTPLTHLTLDTKALWELELSEQTVEAPPVMMGVYYAICHGLDFVYQEDPIARFMFLETLARQPYFSYVALYHLYETLGFWSIASHCKKLHLDQENNECAHLRIMEELGGTRKWKDRFLARHASLAYFAVLLVLYMVSPLTAYKTSELLESHAKFTYQQFTSENKEALEKIAPPPSVELYTPVLESAREMRTLYDVFLNIMDDETTHSETIRFLTE